MHYYHSLKLVPLCRYYIEFLDECLRAHKDNILQENLFIVLTSVEMVDLCQVMAILFFKIIMPLHWLAGNTHYLQQCGINWSVHSIGKAIDALETALIKIQDNGSLYLDESFMNAIFSKIHTDEEGRNIPLGPLEEAVSYQYEVKQTPAIDGSKVLPYDQLNAELFYPQRKENAETTDTVILMASEVAEVIVKELRDPKKATSNYLTSVKGKFSWGQTTDEEHFAFLGKMATNDPAETPFASLTRQLQLFGRMLGIHASAVGHARVNGDFARGIGGTSKDGAYHQLSNNMCQSLLQFALNVAPIVRKSEKVALDKQRESKRKRQEEL